MLRMVALALVLGWLLLGVGGVVMTAWWSRALWKSRKHVPRRTKLIAVVVASSALAGALGTLLGLVKAFGAVGGESLDPSQKARILAEGIAEAMNWTTFGLVVWLPSTIALIFLMRKHGKRAE
jgi:biopolymer transport protein ExbB/TolQ